jgi:hypothetical protein
MPIRSKSEKLASVLNKIEGCYFFLHNTSDRETAGKILEEGFIFESQLSHSTDLINPSDPVELTYFFLQRKEYGHYTIIIAISKQSFKEYTVIAQEKNTIIEEIMSICEPVLSENEEYVYKLSNKHILGFYDNVKEEFTRNQFWEPAFINTDDKECNCISES